MKYFTQGRALVIGVGSYSDKRWDTPTASRDARGCYDALVDPNGAGYARSAVEILLDTDATREGVGKALERLADRCTAESVVFISITSHGAMGDDGLYYLATSDTQFTVERDEHIRGKTGFSVVDLARALRAIPSRQVLVVVNSCFAGHLGPRLVQGRVGPDSLIALPEAASQEMLKTGEGRAIISASKPDQRSFYHQGADHSYFGQALIHALKGGPESERSGYVGLYELYTTIYWQVRSATMRAHLAQEPTLTLVQGVGPFPVAAYPHATSHDERISQELPQGTAVRELPPGQGMGAAITNAEIAGIVDARGANFSGARGVNISGVTIDERPKPRQGQD
ncbi:caspase family protein [Chloroflexales bacterium ZM16-3]|nr:caspase family protein [Chloroflexales bacterium ZM16-3]